MELTIFKVLDIGNHQISVYGANEDPWFVANEIGEIFGIKNIHQALSAFPEEWNRKQKIKIKINYKKGHYQVQNLSIVNKNALKSIMTKTRKYIDNDVIEFLNENFGINMDIIVPVKESTNIQLAFSHLISQTEYYIDKYKVDLIFTQHKLIIECDEFGHKNYNKDIELERELFLRRQGYSIIQFNPDERNLNIGRVINDIMMKIYNQ